MADLIRKMQEGHTVEDLDTVIDEVYEARGEYDSLGERLDDMEGGAPTPSTSIPAMDGTGSAGTSNQYARADHVHPSDTSKQNALSSTQLDAVNSGIDSEKVEQIETNENNILFNTNTGVKNVAPLKSSVNTGSAIVTFTQNADKSYTLAISATTSGAVGFDISGTFTLDSTMQYILSGNPSSGAVRLVLAEGVTPFNWIDQQYGNNPKTITPVANKLYKLSVFIYANTSATTLILKPMICPKSLYDSDSGYQPYAMSNAELTAAIQALQAQLANQ